MIEPRFETAFLKAVKKHASIKKQVKQKVDMIIENPVAFGEPLKGSWQGFYSCPVKRNFIIIYLYCEICRKKGDDVVVEVEENRPIIRALRPRVIDVDPDLVERLLREEYDFELAPSIEGPYHCVIVAVNHTQYTKLDEAYFQSITHEGAIFADLKGIFRDQITKLQYWSL